MQTLLAIDAASVTGWALWGEDMSSPIKGRWDFRNEWSTDGHKFCDMQRRLNELRQVANFNRVRVEFNPHAAKGWKAQYVTLGFVAAVEMYCAAYNIRCSRVTTESWRVAFIGKQESQIIKRAARARAAETDTRYSARDPLKLATIGRCKELGIEVADDNEADAIGILADFIDVTGLHAPWVEQINA